ncbi:hypothetical protein NIES37_40900 [Tolypothrix tenuis PCC 7101]|uniref:Uncharacterized protein n=1 Tax=Tolypothrix tenuis PCC 7101 TaxID=231146 RepID=A0A1Z4N319_9CYAN|nr:hypothetical protein [Aulosira sp. FACHB-113]BAZ00107.1 hypothetical protein NIES37_40900 [Tolypothrix tenuis PCC 7101]BAZ75972.1 hypothetical protein NIES50_45690 [Aulosira laxa NIES-50]
MPDSSFVGSSQNNATTKRDVKQVPFVELYNHRLQGVVSSGSDIERVYVSFFEAGTLDFYCSTNNNRPCGGLGGYPCKHLQSVMKEAIAAYGIDQVINYLKVPGDLNQITSPQDILNRRGTVKKEPASEVFSRFLNYLRYLELPTANSPLPEMSWFV